MNVDRTDQLPVRSDGDVVRVRQVVRERAVAIGLSLVDQTKLVTAASEIARNTLEHGGGGTADVQLVTNTVRKGVRLIFTDQGKGIADVDQALRDGFTSGKGMGLGLGGSRRLVNEMSIETEVGKGTVVTLVKWK